MGDRELEPVDDEEKKNQGLNEEDLALQKIYNYDSKVHSLKDPTCSICLIDIKDSEEMGKDQEPGSEQPIQAGRVMVCTLTCGHSFHAPCVLGWLTK